MKGFFICLIILYLLQVEQGKQILNLFSVWEKVEGLLLESWAIAVVETLEPGKTSSALPLDLTLSLVSSLQAFSLF